MNKTKPTLLILAAGLGSRYGSLKQMDRIGPSGERIIDYSVYDAIRAGFGKIVYVIRKSFEEEFKEVILDELPDYIQTDYVCQELDTFKTSSINIKADRTKPWGTGHALLSASSIIDNSFVVINADDFYGADSYKIAFNFLAQLNNENSTYALVGFKLNNTLSDYGSVSRGICEIDDKNYMTTIVERTEIKREKDHIIFKDNNNWKELTGSEVVSMNMFAFTPTVFEKYKKSFNEFLEKHGDDPKAEFYLPSVIDELLKKKEARVKVLETTEQWFGLTFNQDKAMVVKKLSNLLGQGKYPSALW